MRLKLTLFLLAAASGFLLVNPAKAATSSSNITVRPFLQNITINPGEKNKQFELTITNGSSARQVFHLSTLNFGALNETGGIVFQGADVSRLASKYSLAKWLTLEKTEFVLDAGAQANVKVSIRNDGDLAPGAHYAAIIVTASQSNAAGGQLSVTPKVSSLVFATKKGGEIYDMHLASLTHNGSIWHLPSAVSLSIKSTGNTFIIPRGVVNVKQDDIIIKHGVINEQSSLVLPETSRNFDVPLTDVANLNKGVFLTHYRIQVDYRYDGFNQFATTSFTYTVVNKTTLIIIAVGLILIIAIFKRPRIKGQKKKSKPAPNKPSPVVKLSRLNIDK